MNAIFIGGPHDGRCYQVETAELEFAVWDFVGGPKETARVFQSREGIPVPMCVTRVVRYRRCEKCVGAGESYIYRPIKEQLGVAESQV